MATRPYDATLKDMVEGYPYAWPGLLGPWPVRGVALIDADAPR